MKDKPITKRTRGCMASGGFADFFLYMPEEKMQRVFKQAARRANSDQRRLYAKYRRKDL